MGKKINGSIIDSSVILSAILGEDDAENVRRELKKRQRNLYAIPLLDIEVSNVLVQKLEDFSLIQRIYTTFKDLNINYLDVDELALVLARQIAFNTKSSVYDALYHSTAIVHGYDFITLDRKYYKGAAPYGHIYLIK